MDYVQDESLLSATAAGAICWYFINSQTFPPQTLPNSNPPQLTNIVYQMIWILNKRISNKCISISVSCTHLSHGCRQAPALLNSCASDRPGCAHGDNFGAAAAAQWSGSQGVGLVWRTVFPHCRGKFSSEPSDPWSFPPSLNSSGIFKLEYNHSQPSIASETQNPKKWPQFFWYHRDCLRLHRIYFQIEKKTILMNGRTPTFRMNVKQMSSVRKYDKIRFLNSRPYNMFMSWLKCLF